MRAILRAVPEARVALGTLIVATTRGDGRLAHNTFQVGAAVTIPTPFAEAVGFTREELARCEPLTYRITMHCGDKWLRDTLEVPLWKRLPPAEVAP